MIDQTSGQALAGVSVQVKGSKVGESTDATGSFRINVEPGTVLIFSIVGYENQEVKTDSRLEYTISMVPKTGRLDAVVVSALGIKRTEKSLSYASRQIGGEQVSNVKADPATAKLHVEKALADPGGLLSISSDLAQIFGIGSYQNPLYGISVNYNDIRMGASSQSILVGYNDPRLPKYFSPATDPALGGQYVGIRIGSTLPAKPGYNGFSALNTSTSFIATASMIMMTAAEIWFLKAEAALRGWANSGDAQTNYENGINTSFTQWGVSSASYISDATSKPANYANPKNTADNTPVVSSITIKWNAASSNEVNLKRIITQKWIAMFPEGQEAWTEFRHTGYPKLFCVIKNKNPSNGTISTDIQVRRLAYPAAEYNGTNLLEVQKGLQLLNGPDNGGTRVWWDVIKPNF